MSPTPPVAHSGSELEAGDVGRFCITPQERL